MGKKSITLTAKFEIDAAMMPFHHYWGRHIYKFTILTIFLWTFLLAIYLQFYSFSSWMWTIFILGVPIQVALAIWAFIKPKPLRPKKLKKLKEKEIKKKNNATLNGSFFNF